ncbi:MAG: flagellar hook-associated protein FlgK [Alphaproteobacteria bacterium]
MGLASLDAALSGLRVAQQQINLISTNIANVGTPGYTRKILPQTAQSVGGVTIGVLSQTITRNVDINLERDLWTQVSGTGLLDVKQNYLSKVDAFHGPPDKELSVAAALARLQDSFSNLSDSPQDVFRLAGTVDQAVDTATKINDLARFLNTLRNDAQNELESTVTRINDLLGQIAATNEAVRGGGNANRSIAAQADQRGNAVKELAQLIEITYFMRGDGVMVVQTNQGVELAGETVTGLTFNPTPLSAQSYYPESAGAVYVGNAATGMVADITGRLPGGKIGGLLELRDTTFPRQSAQLDEVAHKLALRLEAQGLRLFTDASGNVPSNAPPNLSIDPPTAVAYVGFASQMRVNNNIIANNRLLQQGTYGATLPNGSTEVIRRVVEFGFGSVDYQEAIGGVDLDVSGNAPPNNTLQSYLGLRSQNTVNGTRNLSAFAAPADLISAADGALDPGSNTMRFTFEEPDLSLGPINIDINLASVTNTAGNLTQDIIAYINGTIIPGLLPAPASQNTLTSMGVVFSEGSNGQLVVTANADITTDGTVVANGMGEDGLALLGFAEDTFEPTDPYFDIQVGNRDFVRITIEPADDETDLLAKLQVVTGLAVEDFSVSPDGFLRLRPGNDYDDPDFGGDLQIVGGPFTASAAGVGVGVVPNGIGIVTALFGSFTTGPLVENSPVENVNYSSLVDASIGSGTTSFRTSYLGPGANISTGVAGAGKIVEFGQKMISQQTQELLLTQTRFEDEDTLRQALERQFADESGVNLDEELGNLIVIQNAYAAAARVLNAVDQLFEELLNTVR